MNCKFLAPVTLALALALSACNDLPNANKIRGDAPGPGQNGDSEQQGAPDPRTLLQELRQTWTELAPLDGILGGGKPTSEADLDRFTPSTSNYSIQTAPGEGGSELKKTSGTYDTPFTYISWFNAWATASYEVTQAWYESVDGLKVTTYIGIEKRTDKNGKVLETIEKTRQFFEPYSENGYSFSSNGVWEEENVVSSSMRAEGRYISDRKFGAFFKANPASTKSETITYTPKGGGAETTLDRYEHATMDPESNAQGILVVRIGRSPGGVSFRSDTFVSDANGGETRVKSVGRANLANGSYLILNSEFGMTFVSLHELEAYSADTKLTVGYYGADGTKKSELVVDGFTYDAAKAVVYTGGSFTDGSGNKLASFKSERPLRQYSTWPVKVTFLDGTEEQIDLYTLKQYVQIY